MTFTDIITEESRPMTTEEIKEQQFFRRLRWGLVGLYVFLLGIAALIFWAGVSVGRAGWGL